MTPEGFAPYVLPQVIGCPDPLLKQAVVMASIEFCQQTLAWTEIQDPVLLIGGVADYDLEAPSSDAIVVTVRDVWLGVKRLIPTNMEALPRLLPNWSTAESSEPLYYNAAHDRNIIRVFPKPVSPAPGLSLVMRAAYMPTANAATLPDFLGQRYMEVISSGAKYRLMTMPGVAWSNPTLGTYYRQLFDAGVVEARIAEAHDRTPGSISVQSRRFGF